MKDIETQYEDVRTKQLADKSNAELIKMVASLELELLDYADRFLSDDPNFDHVFPIETLEMMDKEAITLFKELDTEQDYDGLASYDEH